MYVYNKIIILKIPQIASSVQMFDEQKSALSNKNESDKSILKI